MGQRIVSIARDFTKYPAGRYVEDGPFSGAAFRERFLVPALQAGEFLVIELDGVRGYGSSFLEEAFGGLVRKGFEPAQVKQSLKLVASDLSLVDEIFDYIEHGNEPAEDD